MNHTNDWQSNFSDRHKFRATEISIWTHKSQIIVNPACLQKCLDSFNQIVPGGSNTIQLLFFLIAEMYSSEHTSTFVRLQTEDINEANRHCGLYQHLYARLNWGFTELVNATRLFCASPSAIFWQHCHLQACILQTYINGSMST